MEAMRALKRRLPDVVNQRMLNDALTTPADAKTDPGRHTGATTTSSAADSNPTIDPSDKSLPGPATHHPTTPLPTHLDTEGSQIRMSGEKDVVAGHSSPRPTREALHRRLLTQTSAAQC
jgi:hypothetical protein